MTAPGGGPGAGDGGAVPGPPPYDYLPDGLVVADEQHRVIVWNTAAERVTGIPAAAAMGKDLEDALPLDGPEGRRWWSCAAPWTSLPTVTGHAERLLLVPGGREVLVTSRYVRTDPRGPVHRVVVCLRDARARQREEQSRAELISTVAHELRSPLTSVKGFTATLLARWDRFTDAQKRLMLETVDADADRVTRLISELLDIARIDSGRVVVRRQLVDPVAAVRRHVAGLVASGLGEDRFVVEVRDPLPELWADADKVDQVLGNLLGNAVHHGAGTVTVVVEPGEEPGSTAVTVLDQGEGIPPEQQARVFTKWWRSGRRGGTGLGLYIVRGLVEAHGGTVTLGEAPGGGAMFRFVLPDGTPELAG
ncbi:ATP-binding protein [Vallicoccus soli]|uniref:histidine kinase n=1 Tax=Vallicoccus soli TaxID=2339232 RepID=A0A3A3Z376_9ACTN|nr:ATP-binding protein [Vallicoccus soli]RJK97169.1 PAS domain-containing protein [Vallicoccus soli]